MDLTLQATVSIHLLKAGDNIRMEGLDWAWLIYYSSKDVTIQNTVSKDI